MKTLNPETADLIRKEIENIPEKYHQDFHSVHEGYGVLLEEVRELETEIFFGEKKHRWNHGKRGDKKWKEAIRKEATQVAAMAVRIIQELT